MATNITQNHSRGWSCLPKELQDMILEHCTRHPQSEARRLAGTDQLAVLTTVCRDWQDFFEDKLFQRLTLKTEVDIQIFAHLVQGRRRARVEWIWLRVELPMYDCQQCHRLETREDIRVQKAIFTDLIWKLFDVLSGWKKRDVRNDGIILELSAHSPSDSHHFNKDLRFRLDDTAWYRWEERPVPPHNDPFHGWIGGKQVKKVPLNAKYHVFGFGLRFDYTLPSVRRLRMRLPKVSVVTSLVIRRQFARTIAARKALDPMIRSLTRLNSFTYEPWRGPTSKYQGFQDLHYAFLARKSFKSRRRTLKKVAIFESHDEILCGPNQRRTTALFSCELARSSHNLEELYVANNIDAFHFFYAFRAHAPLSQRRWMMWKNLKYLSLTSQHLSPEHSGVILSMAARAAERMPQLKIMELWNCCSRRGEACIFRYQRGETEASIELVNTWLGGLPAGAKAAWARVATLQRPLMFHCKVRHWNPGFLDGDYAVLEQLELKEHMLHPISLRQIAREDQRRREERIA